MLNYDYINFISPHLAEEMKIMEKRAINKKLHIDTFSVIGVGPTTGGTVGPQIWGAIIKAQNTSHQPTPFVGRFLLFRDTAMFTGQYLRIGESCPHKIFSAHC